MNEEFTGSLSLQQQRSRKRKWETKMKMVRRSKVISQVLCIVGVISTLLLYELFQEAIAASPCGEAYMEYSSVIVLCSSVLTSIMAGFYMLITRKDIAPVASVYEYGAISLSNALATACQYSALKHVSFPVRTLGKCAKMLLVMVWGTLISRKKYSIKDYLSTGLGIVASVVFFLLIPSSEPLQGENESTFWGVVLMSGDLGFDSFTRTFQDKLFKDYDMDIFNEIFYTTLCFSVLSTIVLVFQGQWLHIIDFVLQHPDCIYDVLRLSCAATMNHFFISYTIRTCGARFFVALMTARQLLSTDLPFLFFPSSRTAKQWGTLIVVFGALLYSTSYMTSLQNDGKGSKCPEKEKLKVQRKLGDTDVSGKQNPSATGGWVLMDDIHGVNDPAFFPLE